VDDLADACIFVLKHYAGSKFLNIGTGKDITICEFAQLVADVVGYHGRFVFDASRLDGVPQMLEGAKEDKAGWSGFLKHLKERGLHGVRLIISDACMGLSESAADFFPDAAWQRCIVYIGTATFSVMCPRPRCARSRRCSRPSTPARTSRRHGRRLSK
jgi:Transposase, Mutator family